MGKKVKQSRKLKRQKKTRSKSKLQSRNIDADMDSHRVIAGDDEIMVITYSDEQLGEATVERQGDVVSLDMTQKDGDKIQTVASLVRDYEKRDYYEPKNKLILPTPDTFKIGMPPPKVSYTRKGQLTAKSRRAVEAWEQTRQQWEAYLSRNITPLWAGSSNSLVSFEHFETLPTKKAIAEKPSFFSDQERSSEDFAQTAGNQLQARVNRDAFLGLFEQKRSGANKQNPTPTIFRTKQVRVDNDDMGHYIAAMNNMYAWGDPYLPYMYVQDKKTGDWVRMTPDPIRVNREHAKNILNSIGNEQAKIIKKVLEQSLGGKKALTFRGLDGSTQNLSLSEQQLAIVHYLVDDQVVIMANTPSRRVQFEIPEDFDWEKARLDADVKEMMRFIPSSSVKKHESNEPKIFTSDDLLIAAVSKYDMEPDTVQALAESLNKQGWITYPRVDAEKAQSEGLGIEMQHGRTLEAFRGSEEERKLLEIIHEANQRLKQGKDYLLSGRFELQVGEITLTSKPVTLFADEDLSFGSEEIDLDVDRRMVSSLELTSHLINEGIGTPATRTQLLSALRKAGVITSFVQDNERRYKTDQRGIYMASAYQYLLDHPEHSVLEHIHKLKKADDLEAIEQVLEDFEFVDEKEFRKAIVEYADEILDFEHDITIIEAL